MKVRNLETFKILFEQSLWTTTPSLKIIYQGILMAWRNLSNLLSICAKFILFLRTIFTIFIRTSLLSKLVVWSSHSSIVHLTNLKGTILLTYIHISWGKLPKGKLEILPWFGDYNHSYHILTEPHEIWGWNSFVFVFKHVFEIGKPLDSRTGNKIGLSWRVSQARHKPKGTAVEWSSLWPFA